MTGLKPATLAAMPPRQGRLMVVLAERLRDREIAQVAADRAENRVATAVRSAIDGGVSTAIVAEALGTTPAKVRAIVAAGARRKAG